jgi:hypothetical protein
VIWLYGYGWPIYRGGPMFYADQVGLKHIADRLSFYAKETNDPSLEPAPLSSASPPKARPSRRWRIRRKRRDGALLSQPVIPERGSRPGSSTFRVRTQSARAPE